MATEELLQTPTARKSPSGPFGTLRYRGFIRDVGAFSLSNVVAFALGFVQAFLVPKYLSIESYGYWKLFTLYVAFAGLLHLGFADGVYLRWAGKDLTEFGKEIPRALRFLLLEGTTFAVLLGGISVFIPAKPPLQFIGLAVLINCIVANVVTLFQFVFQAVRAFRLVSLVNAAVPIFFVSGAAGLVILKRLEYTNLIGWYICGTLLAALAYAWILRYQLQFEKVPFRSILHYGKKHIALGWFILLGNFMTVLFFSLDRLVVSSSFQISDFAMYSFAVSVFGIINLLINSTASVAFPYLSGSTAQMQRHLYHAGESLLIVLWGGAMGLYFPFSRLIPMYLPQYTSSLTLVQVLLCSLGFGSIIQIVHSNYYKVNQRQRHYFLTAIAAAAFTVGMIQISIRVWGGLKSVAVATVFGFLLWYLVNEFQLRALVSQTWPSMGKRLVGILAFIGAFWVTALGIKSLGMQLLVYYLAVVMISVVLFSREIKTMASG